jgi:hypothetical protein
MSDNLQTESAVPSEPLPAAGGPVPYPSIVLDLPQLARLERMLEAALEGRGGQAWYTLEQAWRRKFASSAGVEGAISLSSIKMDMALQPRGGVPDGWQSNRKVWKEESVEEWCLVDDGHLEEYLKKHNPNRRVPARIKEKLAARVPVVRMSAARAPKKGAE